MKNIKFILFLCISITLLSCGDNDDSPEFTLTTANIAGNYEISSIEVEEKETATGSSGASVDISTTIEVGDSFDDVSFVMNANGTFTATGKFRSVETLTTVNGGTSAPVSSIIVFDSAGSYTINSSENTITFDETSGDFIDGEFKVVTFTENTVNITQEDMDVDGGITISSKESINLSRK
ncbi:hypothetical protein [uncultured Polaribacter sp.]|uniref:hypothetical protein n=1 Tax=uncultured Polaribacter sp. TaxID=174711 RepID=UPI00260EF81D|nr:hypothetical protein [uncultured Polaribacter sp.]